MWPSRNLRRRSRSLPTRCIPRTIREWPARELDETNRGVVALYAELDDQAEELRRAKEVSETRFLAVYRHAPCGIALIDANGLIVEANLALEALLGRRVESWELGLAEYLPQLRESRKRGI